ncbi:MAG: DUF3291 domain-containing protein [Acidimicrobiia bacterium]|jgi:hypothetical protein
MGHETAYHLAQANLAELRYPLGSPEMAEFEAALDPVNELADGSPGFVWRQEFDYLGGDRPIIFGRDDYLFTLSVWQDIDRLREFTYGGRHAELLSMRLKWFLRDTRPTLVMWWIPRGELPTVSDAEARLLHIRDHGPTPYAFNFAKRFAPTTPSTL